MKITLPIRTKSGLNAREHWSIKATRAKAHRRGAVMAVRAGWLSSHGAADVRSALGSGLTVTLVRVAPRPLDGHDNLRDALKSCVDGIAEALGLESDDDARVTWRYGQRRGSAREYTVEVVISPRVTCDACGQVTP